MADADESRKRDADFACRLESRDFSVVAEIERHYIPALLARLRLGIGSYFNEQDAEDVVNEALLTVWRSYNGAAGKSVRGFLFDVARCRMVDCMRRRRVERMHLPKLADNREDIEVSSNQALADGGYLSIDTIHELIEGALAGLSPRQKTAFRRRFLDRTETAWAKDLESETKYPARNWRKASDEARQHVEEHLKQNGIIFDNEGGQYVQTSA